MASDEEFVRQNEELVDLRFALRRADSELELLRRERNLLRKELVLREAEIERTIALVERTNMVARLEAAEALAEDRLHRLEALEGHFSNQSAPPDEPVSVADPGSPWLQDDDEPYDEPYEEPSDDPPTDIELPPGAQLPPGTDPQVAQQAGRGTDKKRSRFRADLRQARRTSLP